MQLGISTKVMRDYPLEQTISIIGKLGYDIIELWIDDYLRSGLSAIEVSLMTTSQNLKTSIHLRTDDINIASFNEGIRKESVKQTQDGIYFASKLGAKEVTLHPGRKTSKTNTFEDAWQVQIESIKELSLAAEECGVTLCVEGMENIPGEFVKTPVDLSKVLESVGSDALGVTIDIAHFETIGNTLEILEQSKNLPIQNVHISQTSKDKLHLPVYSDDGLIDYLSVFKKLSSFYDGGVVVEGYVKNFGLEIAEKSINLYKDILKECV